MANYSGSQIINGCTIYQWTDNTYDSFKLTQDCRMSVNGTPAITAKAGDEFTIYTNTPYIFDRTTKVLLAYPDTLATVSEWSYENAYTYYLATGSIPEFNAITLAPGINESGLFRIRFHMALWHGADAENVKVTLRVKQVGVNTEYLMDQFFFYTPYNTGSNAAVYSFLARLNFSVYDALTVTFTLDVHTGIGNSDTGTKNIIAMERLYESTTYQNAWMIDYHWVETKTIDTTANDGTPYGIFVSNLSGLKLYIVGDGGNAVDTYTMTTANDTSTATYVGTYAITQDTVPTDVFFNNAATLMFITGTTNDSIYTYSLSTPDVITSGVTYVRTYSFTSQDTNVRSACFSTDGLKLWMAGQQNSKIYEYSLTTAFNTSTMSYTGNSLSIDGLPYNVRVSDDSKYLYVLVEGTDPIVTKLTQYEINGSVANYDVIRYTMPINRNTGEYNYEGFDISYDGKKIYLIGTADDVIREVQLGY